DRLQIFRINVLLHSNWLAISQKEVNDITSFIQKSTELDVPD
ncbi:23044_t:CDS:1, partial [Gigaspora rosea]